MKILNNIRINTYDNNCFYKQFIEFILLNIYWAFKKISEKTILNIW